MTWTQAERRRKARKWLGWLTARLEPPLPVRIGPDLPTDHDAEATTTEVDRGGFHGFEIRMRPCSRSELADRLEHEYAHVLSATIDGLWPGRDHHPAYWVILGRVHTVFRSIE